MTPPGVAHDRPDSATGDLAGLTGTCVFAHNEQVARLTLTFELAEN